jgi:hypothetical protein
MLCPCAKDSFLRCSNIAGRLGYLQRERRTRQAAENMGRGSPSLALPVLKLTIQAARPVFLRQPGSDLGQQVP